ncbi:hypothetical protein B4N89_28755 [Embleya scabrispora]|uniref:SH3b domain-containing protein n=1 Tax=Embleya scabrispora TaxID=159449 RepID=A0A1T3P5Q1_9ACTN|nr:hypothetical protein [Embleya scabrispora]OPC84383.1 hypothetical protein B4N89_28755 [Embleya scabrispora]
MDNRRRAEFFSTPNPIGGPPRGRFGLNALSRHPVRILMVAGGLILLVIVFFVALLTVDGGGSGDKKKSVDATGGKSSSASPSPGKSGTGKATTGPGQSAAGPKPGSVAATVHTGGWLVMYKGTSYQSDKVVQIKTGTEVRANCHAEGSIAYYAGSSSKTWAQIDVEGRTGFVPAIFLDTGGDVSKQIPACTS